MALERSSRLGDGVLSLFSSLRMLLHEENLNCDGVARGESGADPDCAGRASASMSTAAVNAES